MPKIQLLSDLHLDASRMDIDTQSADVVLIVGDTAYEDSHYDWLLRKLGGKPTIIVPGNHEYDGWDIETRDKELKSLCSEYPNTYYLNNEAITLQGIKFIGSCLWTDFQLDSPTIPFNETLTFAKTIGHLKTIKKNGRSLTATDIIELHNTALEYLEFELLKNNPGPDTPVVVATHFAPSKQSISPVYQLSNNAYHAVNLERLMGLSDFWVHGHIHDSFNYAIEGTQVVCNPRGYSKTFGLNQNQKFNSQLFLDIDVAPQAQQNNSSGLGDLNKKLKI